MNCGKPLASGATSHAAPLARSPGHLLGILTLRLIFVIFGLALIRAILMRLPFTQSIRITNFPLTVENIVNAAIYLIVLLILLAYARSLLVLWPQAFPRFRDAGMFLAALVYIGVLVALYYTAGPIIIALEAGSDLFMWFEVIMLAIAIVLLIWAGIALYRFLPIWLSSINLSPQYPQSLGVACLNCGSLNNASARYCSNCGNQLVEDD
jgi:hypothetical protein